MLNKTIRKKAAELGIHPKNLIRWYNAEDLREKRGNRKALFPEMEDILKQYVLSNPYKTRRHVITQAKQFMDKMEYPE